MPGPIVAAGDRVTLRTVESEDLGFCQRASANPELRHPLGNPVRHRDDFEVSTERGHDQFLVCLDDDAGDGPVDADAVRRVGNVNVMDAAYKRPELGYWLVPEIHGQGYGTEAVSLVVDYAFREYDAPAIGAGAFDCNEASRALLESLGFEEEGRRRRFMYVDGAHRDMVQYGLLREDWDGGPAVATD